MNAEGAPAGYCPRDEREENVEDPSTEGVVDVRRARVGCFKPHMSLMLERELQNVGAYLVWVTRVRVMI